MNEHTAEKDAPCLGTGGVVYTYEGPQFGSQMVEEACEVCGDWHDRQKAAPTPRRVPWWRRLARVNPPASTHDGSAS